MTYTTNAKTILFASLIVAMILPFSAMNFAEAQTEDSAYIKEVKKQKTIETMGMDEREEFIKKLQKQMNASTYDKLVYKLLEELSQVNLRIIDAEEKDTTQIIEEGWSIVYQLEDYGVVSEDRLLQNRGYWQEKANEAREQLRKGQTVKTTIETSTQSNIKKIHTSDVSLKNESTVQYKCGSFLGIPIYCPQIDVEWGGGSNSHASAVLPHSGAVYMEGKICLHDDGGHDKVIFTFDTKHDVYTIFGNHVFEEDFGPAKNYLSHAWTCATHTEAYGGISAVAGSTAHAKTHLDNTVTVTG